MNENKNEYLKNYSLLDFKMVNLITITMVSFAIINLIKRLSFNSLTELLYSVGIIIVSNFLTDEKQYPIVSYQID